MKRLLILCCLCFLSAKAQVNFSKSYYPFINQAELEIVYGDYKTALSFYDSAFNNVRKPFARDYYNAAVCAIKIKKNELAFNYIDSLIAKGLAKEFIDTCNAFLPLRQQTDWKKYISTFSKKYDRFNRVNRELRNTCKYLRFRAEEYRLKEGWYVLYKDSVKKIDKENIETLQVIINKYGLPQEEDLGIEDPLTGLLPIFSVLQNYCWNEELRYQVNFDLTPLLRNAIQEGKMDAHEAWGLLADMKKADESIGDLCLYQAEFNNQKSRLLKLKLDIKKIEEVDQLRLSNGLETYNDFFRKAQFVHKNPLAKDFSLSPFKKLQIYYYEKEESYKLFVERAEELE